MKALEYTASYSNCCHNFIIAGLPEETTDDQLLISFIAVMRNILQRSRQIRPSEYLISKLGGLPDCSVPLMLVNWNEKLPNWELVIKGSDTGYNPARDFFYSDELWEAYLPEYKDIRHLIIPEAPLDRVLEDYSGKWVHQSIDFYIPAAKLDIEIDGTQHQTDQKQSDEDQKRDQALKAKGIHIIRIPVADLKSQNLAFAEQMVTISNILDSSEKLQTILRQNEDIQKDQRIQYETVIRYQFLILALLECGELSYKEQIWKISIPDIQQELFRIAFDDLSLWLKNLYAIKGLSLAVPSLDFGNGPDYIELCNEVFGRYDGIPKQIPTVFNSRWDDRDFYHVESAQPINYEIPWPEPEDSSRARAVLFMQKNIFGEEFSGFKKGQWPIIANILCRRKTIGILPTGGGKSLCYQMAACLQPGITIVICPINSLQIDQKRNLDEAGFTNTAYIVSEEEGSQKKEILNRLNQSRYQIVWISPERLQTKPFRNTITGISQKQTIAYAVIDEVHCLSEWGHDFRTSYLTLIRTLKNCCNGTPLIGLTATASQAVLSDLKAEFEIGGESIRALPSLERENLTFRVITIDGKARKEELFNILNQHHYGEKTEKPDSGIVFTLTRDRSNENIQYAPNMLARNLKNRYPEMKKLIGAYNGQDPERFKTQKEFLEGEKTLLSSTKAFGMGVNKKDLRFTVHYQLPWSVEAFYQEAGRAGRDEKPAECIILFTKDQFGEKKYIDKAFAQDTSPETIKEYTSKNLIKGDLSTIFHLWNRNNKGLNTDRDMIREVLNRLSSTRRKTDPGGNVFYTLHADKGDDKDDDAIRPKKLTRARLELALYRLLILGVVQDWTIDWRGQDNTYFDIYADDQITTESLEKHVLEYIQRRAPEYTLPESTPISNPEQYRDKTLTDLILWYAEHLIEWTYKHIVYSRKWATKTILEMCNDYNASSFRSTINNYLRISESSILLDGMVQSPRNWKLWFQSFYQEDTNEEGSRSRKLLNSGQIDQLRLSCTQYKASYFNLTGLDLVYVLAGAIDDRNDRDTEELLLRDSLRRITALETSERDDLWNDLIQVIRDYKDRLSRENSNMLARQFVNAFPEKARDIQVCLEDPYSLSCILKDAKHQIQKAMEAML